MRLLTLMRHAKSSWKDPLLDDFDRPLKKRGKRDAPAMGDRLAARGFRPDRVVTSPAKRARQTAEAVAERIGWPPEGIEREERLYAASAGELLEIVRELDDAHGHVLLFGHNPAFTELAEILTGEDLGNVPTAGVVEIALDVDGWRGVDPGRGALVRFDRPREPA